ncbi:hypothetical protein AAG906_015609 [Vitis piasezkii]
MEIPHEDQSSHYDHEKDKFAYLSMRDQIELGKRQVQQSQWGSKYALNEDMSMKAKLASMARRIEEFELGNVHTEAQPQAMPTSFEYINHPNLTTQPQPQPSMSTSSLEQAIFKISKVMEDFVEKVQDSIEKLTNLDIARGKESFLLNPTITFKEPMQKIKESVDDRHFGGDCFDNFMDQPSIENHKVQDDKGLLEPFKASTSPRKRRETNSLDQMGRMYDACKNRNGGETEETGEPKCISKALGGILHHEHTHGFFAQRMHGAKRNFYTFWKAKPPGMLSSHLNYQCENFRTLFILVRNDFQANF